MLQARHTCLGHPPGYLHLRGVRDRVGQGVIPLSQRREGAGRRAARATGATAARATAARAGKPSTSKSSALK